MVFQNKAGLIIFILVSFLLVAIGLYFLNSGKQTYENGLSVGSVEIIPGQQLATGYCVRCHTLPEPRLLPKQTWRDQTLPHMGPQLGIFSHNGVQYPIERTANLPTDYYPSSPLISSDEWQSILDYYETAAPERLPEVTNTKQIRTDSLFFQAHSPEYRSSTPPLVTAIRLDPGNKKIYLSDASQAEFLVFNESLEMENRLYSSSAMSQIEVRGDLSIPGQRNFLLTHLGSLNPSDALTGFIMEGQYDPETNQATAGSLVFDNIARPVQTQVTNLNHNNEDDILINEFGHRSGGLFWIEDNDESEGTEKNMLIDTPGCIESDILDYNSDGLLDVIALCSQTEQSIFLFLNQNNGQFEGEKLLQFDITAGSTSFEMHDFNQDGFLDILYTNGDNADYSRIYKPYHGVAVYLNDGNNDFQREWFYSINGAYKAIARDFNKDGELDIAVISFFADYENRPEDGFLFFLNEGEMDFTPYHHPAGSNGRWLTMDVADWTGDGYDDIVLANFSIGPTTVHPDIQNRWAENSHFLLLENRFATQDR